MGHVSHGAEIACKWTTVAGVVRYGPFTHESATQILFCFDSVVRVIRQHVRIWRLIYFGGSDAIILFVGQIRHGAKVITSANGVSQLFKSMLTASLHNKVNILRSEASLVMLSGEIAAPNDLQIRVSFADFFAERNTVIKLRTGHDRNA